MSTKIQICKILGTKIQSHVLKLYKWHDLGIRKRRYKQYKTRSGLSH